jgi:hypothetical protein
MKVMAGGKAPVQGQPANPEKIPYEQLEGMAVQCQQENGKLRQENAKLLDQCRQLQGQLSLVRLNFLFEVAKNPDKFPETLVNNALEEVGVALYPPRARDAAGNEAVEG